MCKAGVCSIFFSGPSKGLLLPAGPPPSCFAFTAGLFTGLSVQREGNFYAAFISSRCEGSPRWMDICCVNEFAHRFNCKPGTIFPEQNCLCLLFPLPLFLARLMFSLFVWSVCWSGIKEIERI